MTTGDRQRRHVRCLRRERWGHRPHSDRQLTSLFSTARGSLATSSLRTATALHLLLLSQWHGESGLLPPAFTSSWLPLTQPGHWAPLPASPGHKVRFPTAFLDSCVFIAHCGELIWVGKSSKCSVLQAGALRKVKDGKVAPWWWWGGEGGC